MTAAAASPETGKSRFALPSAYTILFILIVLVALADLDHPGRQVRHEQRRRADPGDVPPGATRTRSGSSSIR